MKMNFVKLGDIFLHNVIIYNNLFQFSHKRYGLAETKSEANFHVFQRTISAINFKELFWTNGI